VVSEREATREVRHHHDRGHEQEGNEVNAEEDGQFGEGTKVADDRDRDHARADGELGQSGHGEPSNPDHRASDPFKPGPTSGAKAWYPGHALPRPPVRESRKKTLLEVLILMNFATTTR
jgi:hypothetical protein